MLYIPYIPSTFKPLASEMTVLKKERKDAKRQVEELDTGLTTCAEQSTVE